MTYPFNFDLEVSDEHEKHLARVLVEMPNLTSARGHTLFGDIEVGVVQ